MRIQHEIISFDPNSGSIQVQYLCDEIEAVLIYSIDIPIENNTYPSREVIDSLIEMARPVGQFERLMKVRAAVAPEWLMQLVPPQPTPVDLNTDQPMIGGVDELPQ